MEQITTTFSGFNTGEVLTADKMNSIITGLNSVIIPKINELVTYTENLYQLTKNQLDIHQARINELSRSINSGASTIDGNIYMATAILNKSNISVRANLVGLNSTGSVWHVIGEQSGLEHSLVPEPIVDLFVDEYWRIDKGGNFEDSVKHKVYTGKTDILKNLSFGAQFISATQSLYPTITYDNTYGTSYIQYRGLYDADGYPSIDDSKNKMLGKIEINRGWELNHGIKAINPDTGEYVDINTTPLNFVYLVNVPTLYEVFSKKDTEYKYRILDRYYGGNSLTLDDLYYTGLSNNIQDWWWIGSRALHDSGATPAAFLHKTRNIDNVDVKALGEKNRIKYNNVAGDIFIADGARFNGSVDCYIGDLTVAHTSTSGPNILPDNLDDLTLDTDLGTLHTFRQYVAIKPNLDASLAGAFFVIPGLQRGATEVDWDDFKHDPQQYINQYLGKTQWPGPDVLNNNRDKTNSFAKSIYYSYPGWEEAAHLRYIVNDREVLYKDLLKMDEYTNGNYKVFSPNDIAYGRKYIAEHGWENFLKNIDDVRQEEKTNYETVTRLYFHDDGFYLKDPQYQDSNSWSRDSVDNWPRNDKKLWWVEGPYNDWRTGVSAYAQSYNMVLKLKKGDILVVLNGLHSDSIRLNANCGGRWWSFMLNTPTPQLDWDGESEGTAAQILNTDKYITTYAGGETYMYPFNSNNPEDVQLQGTTRMFEIPCEDIVADHHHDLDTILNDGLDNPNMSEEDREAKLKENYLSEYIYKRYGGRDYKLYAYKITSETDVQITISAFEPYYTDTYRY